MRNMVLYWFAWCLLQWGIIIACSVLAEVSYGFLHHASLDDNGPSLFTRVAIRLGLLVPILSLIAETWRQRSNRRTKRKRQPTCAKCGYNLTGNVSGICPECGSAVSIKKHT